jgi:hypothetical protein
MQKLDIFEYERPIGIQLFGGDVENMVRSAEIAASVNPDLIDIMKLSHLTKMSLRQFVNPWARQLWINIRQRSFSTNRSNDIRVSHQI